MSAGDNWGSFMRSLHRQDLRFINFLGLRFTNFM